MRRIGLLNVAILALFVHVDLASANLILNTGLVGGSGDVENVLFSIADQSATTVVGELNQSGEVVEFTSDEILINPAGGQARLEAIDGAFSQVSITMQNATLGFTKIQFNIDAADDGFADITLVDQFGTAFLFNQPLNGNGQNFFTGQALDDQVIVSAAISTSVSMTDISDLQQVRIGSTVIPPVVDPPVVDPPVVDPPVVDPPVVDPPVVDPPVVDPPVVDPPVVDPPVVDPPVGEPPVGPPTDPKPVPEPASILIWVFLLGLIGIARRRTH